MIFNLVLYLIVPWLFGVLLYYKDKRIFLTFYPFSCVLAYTLNSLGIYMGFWSFYPYGQSYFISILLAIGLYPIAGTYFSYLIHNKKMSPIILCVVFSIFSTAFKGVLVSMGKTVYANGWNIYLTFILFFAAYSAGYLFYTALKKKSIII